MGTTVTCMDNGDFKAQRGDKRHKAPLDHEQRLAQLKQGENPFHFGGGLPAGSPVFYGREALLKKLTGLYQRPGKPACISLLGERRIGKSSLLNQLWPVLGRITGLISVQASAASWNDDSQQAFHARLYAALRQALPTLPDEPVTDYPALRDQIAANAGRYRFLIVIDEFEVMAGNPRFDGDFFYNLRALADDPDHQLGFLLASRQDLKALCHQEQIAASHFWNIFQAHYVGGLIAEEARMLWLEPADLTQYATVHAKLEALWTEQIEPLAGNYAALIQLAAQEHWIALDGGFPPSQDTLELSLRPHLEELLEQRTPREWEILIRAAAGRDLANGPDRTRLRVRGVLGDDDRPCSGYFTRVIEEELKLPPGKGLDQAVKDIETGLQKGTALSETLLGLLKQAGRWRKAFLDPEDGEDGR